MLGPNCATIARNYFPDDAVCRIVSIIEALGPSDILTAGALAEHTECDRDAVEALLFALANHHCLDLVWRIHCTHPQTPHILWPQSLGAYAEQAQQPCPHCALPLNPQSGRVAFRAIASAAKEPSS